MSTEIDRLEAVAAVVSHAGGVGWLRPELCEVGDQLCRLTDAQAIIAQRDARIAELEAERARWEHLAQKAWDKSDVEFAADIATAIDAVGEKAQRPASQKGLAAQVLKAQDAIKQWPPELRAGVRIPDPKEWLASGQPSSGVVDELELAVSDYREQLPAGFLRRIASVNPDSTRPETCGVVVPRPLLENCASYMAGSASPTVASWHKSICGLLLTPRAQQPSAGVEDEREAFDEWFNDFSLSVRMNGGQMNDAQMFAAWQARARLNLTPTGDGVVLPERADENEGNSYSVMQAMARNQTIDEVARLNHCRAQAALGGKYAEVLVPFFAMMENELHANAGKGDRPDWLQMNRETALLEIYYHLGKLQKATKTNDLTGIVEYAADVANMSMMLVDVCGLLATPSSAKKESGDE